MSFTHTINKLLSGKLKPVFYGLAAGLYPVFFYYSNNYALVKSYKHLLFFVCVFLLVPIVGFWIASVIFNLSFLKKFKKYLLPFLNIWVFLTLLLVCIYAGISIWYIVLTGSIAIIISLFFYNYSSKIVIFQLILAFLGLFTLIPILIKQQSFSKEWKKQPDDIASVQFKKKPNVYFIQPDGYVNPSELKKGYYKIDNSKFENFLTQNNFKIYFNFRSNYSATLPSNSAIFMMKHHYYNRGLTDEEGMDSRAIIMNDNTVLHIFKNNGYKTYFLSQGAYFLLNFPKVGYDYTNFSQKEISFISQGLSKRYPIFPNLEKIVRTDTSKPKFIFIQIFNPRHIRSFARGAVNAKVEKESWLENIDKANKEIEKTVNLILKSDPKALIFIMSDHGGYVGLNATDDFLTKTEDRDLIYSAFSSILAVHLPNNETLINYDTNLKTSVNVFRVLFSYLSENKKYLTHLQDNGSYSIIYKGATRGIYKYINDDGNIVFEKK